MIAGLAAYSNTFGVPFCFDDAPNIINNPAVTEFDIAKTIRYRRAFGELTFQINYLLAGSNLFGYHLTNLLIHITASLLVYTMISLLTKTPYWVKTDAAGANPLPVPLFAALLFAVHPVQTQAVTYIVQRFTSLATMLFIAAIVCYLQGRIFQQSARRSVCRESSWFAGALVAFLLAAHTKEIAFTCPIAILLVELLFFGTGRTKVLKTLLAAVTASMTLLIWFGSRSGSVSNIVSNLDEMTRVQTISSRSDYLFTQFRVICTYLRLLLLPVNQTVDYDYTLSHSIFEWRVLSALLLLLAIFSFAIWLIRISRNGTPYARLSAFGILWFFTTLAVESSFLPIIDLIFEHRVYLPSVGFFIAASTGALQLIWRHSNPFVRHRALQGLLLIALILAGATWKRNLVWTDEVALWEDTVKKSPNSSRAWNNLGGALIKKREGDPALRALIRSIELDPSKADAWNNIGIALDLMGSYKDRFQRTTEMFNDPRAFAGDNLNDWLGNTHNNLGLAYELTGMLPKAVENYRNAIGFKPSLGVAYYNLGLLSAVMGRYDSYGEQMQILRLIDPVLANRLATRAGQQTPAR